MRFGGRDTPFRAPHRVVEASLALQQDQSHNRFVVSACYARVVPRSYCAFLFSTLVWVVVAMVCLLVACEVGVEAPSSSHEPTSDKGESSIPTGDGFAAAFRSRQHACGWRPWRHCAAQWKQLELTPPRQLPGVTPSGR